MLSAYRRHRPDCPHQDDRISRKCRCPIWAKGTITGKPCQRSLKTRSFEMTGRVIRQIEDGNDDGKTAKGITAKAALDCFLKDCESRNLKPATIKKWRRLRASLGEFAERESLGSLISLADQNVIRRYRAGRHLAPNTSAKELERIRSLFSFCVGNGWIGSNPAKLIRPPKVNSKPRIPFAESEVEAMLAKARNDRELAFLLTLRHTGLRIGDARLLSVSQVSDNWVYLYTSKAGIPVSVVIPPTLVSFFKKLPITAWHFFLWGESTHVHSVSNLWRRRIKVICKELGIMPDHPHRFRHSLAADLLTKGASVGGCRRYTRQ